MRFNPRPLRSAAAAIGDKTVTAIAAQLGLPYSSVRRWTSGAGVPGVEALVTIERTYGITAAAQFDTDTK